MVLRWGIGSQRSDLQKVVNELNKTLETIARNEKECLEESTRELEEASAYGGRYESKHLKRKDAAEERSNYFASLRPLVLQEVRFSLFSFRKHFTISLLTLKD